MLACTLELFRQAQTPRKNAAFFRALAEFAKDSQNTNWGAVPFSITHVSLSRGLQVAREYGVAEEQVDDVVTSALLLFADLIEDGLADSEGATPQDIFEAVIAEMAESQKDQPPTKPGAPEIYNERMIARVFKPAQFTDRTATALNAGLVTFRDVLPGGERGPALRGIAFDNGTNTWHMLLETGEFIRRPKNDPSVTGTNTAEDYAEVCPALLAYTRAAVDDLFLTTAVLSEDEAKLVKDQNCLGEFIKPCHAATASKATVKSLESVIDVAKTAATMGCTGATGPVGATVRIPVPGTDYAIVIEATAAVSGPYVIAKLLHHETLVMRLERPRQFSPHGVYLFPLPHCVVLLTIMY